ncbi:MAG: ABC transporter substrate-binding protein [Blastochloris sp.]|nr:ABC transporter substrate-binding protein [Blastochloris sp.]
MFNDPLTTTGSNTFIGQMIELVGAANIFADASEDYPAISPETVFERDPQVILGPDSQGELLTVAALSERPGWADIQAVRDERVYTLDGDIISRPGPRLADAIELLAATLYPEAFK